MQKQIQPFTTPEKFKSRRQFIKAGGVIITSSALLYTCHKDSMPGMTGTTFDLGEGDLGILNYAYALEQLEADFYTKVVNSFYTGISTEEQTVLTDLYNHEVNHREFFKAALTGATNGNTSLITPQLEFNYGSLDFKSRTQVLAVAKTLEDTGVAAYNGAGSLIKNPAYLLLAGKIVSVEARHASAIRSLINPNSADFSGNDVVDSNGLDLALKPSQVLKAVGDTGFIKTKFTASKLP